MIGNRHGQARTPATKRQSNCHDVIETRGRWATLLTTLFAIALLGGLSDSSAQIGPPVNPGFPNVTQVPGAILSGLNAPQQGRLAVIAYHGGVLFTVPEAPSSQPGSDFQVRTWNITDPSNPIKLAQWGETPHPINAHGYFHIGDHVVLGPNWPPGQEWSFRVPSPFNVVRESSIGGNSPGGRGSLFQPWYVGDTYWSYNAVGGNAEIWTLNPCGDWGCATQLASWDHLGLTGVIGHPFLLGDLLIFASEQSRTGVATYDVSDPTNPVLLDVLTEGGPGGYWPEIWGGGGKLYVVFPYRLGGNGMRVVDATDPSDLKFVIDRPLPGAQSMYIQFQDEFAFMGSYKVDMRSFEPVVFFDPNVERPNQPGTMGIDTSQFLLPLGNLLVTGGIGPDQGMAIWAHQAEPDLRGPSVSFHIPQAGRTGYPVGAPISLLIHETLESFTIINGETFIVQPIGGQPISGRLIFSFNDVLTFTPDAPLLPDTTYEVVIPNGGIKDAAGNGIVGYSFTFSTGASLDGNAPPVIHDFTTSSYPVAPGGNVTFTTTATDPDGDPLEFRFDFGDGTPKTTWSSSASAGHTFGTTGHFRATVQARDTSGSIATEATTVTVVDAPAATQPTNSSPVACDEASRVVWTVNPDNDTVTAVDADSLGVLLEFPACDDPRSVDVSADGEIWVACRGDDSLNVVDPNGNSLTTIGLGYGGAPSALVITPDGATAYATLEGSGELVRFDTSTHQQTGSLPLGPGPRAIAVSPDGATVLVTRFLSPKDHAEVWEVSTATLTLNRTIRIPKFGGDAHRDTTASGKGVANYLAGITIAPDGHSAWVAANKPNAERGTLFGVDLDPDNTVRNILVQIDLTTGQVARVIDIDNSDSSTAVAFSPLGDYFFTALQGNNSVVVFDALDVEATSGLAGFVSRLAVGLAPQGICTDTVTNRTFVKNFTSRDLTVLETDALFRSGNISPASANVSTVATEMLPPDVLLGKQVFYNASDIRMSDEGYLSCATCHVDGGHDGRVWDFTGRGEGLRNTTSLRGRAGMAHGNVHWSANFDEIQDFENDIRNAFGGMGFLSDADFAASSSPLGAPKAGRSADLDALAAYVSSLGNGSLPKSPWRSADGTMTDAALRGEGIFDSLACGVCHTPPSYTDSVVGSALLHDVGTLRTTSGQRLGGPLGGIDTPTLLGVWDTAPYLHDGSAYTLEEVFQVAGGLVIPAEDGVPSGGASITDQWVDLNNDDTVHGRAFVYFGPNPASLTFPNVDGGSGGVGAVELRYSHGSPAVSGEIIVNGASWPIIFQDATNDPPWAHVNWLRVRVEGIPLNPGPSNDITILPNQEWGWTDVSLDEIIVSTADDLAAAAPHRVAQAQSAQDRADLIAYLRELDGSNGAAPPPTVTATPTTTRTPTPTSTNTEVPIPVRVDLSRGVGRPGGRACLTATLVDNGASVTAASSTMGFDANVISIENCEIYPAIGNGTAANKSLTHVVHGAGSEQATIDGNPNSLPEGALYTCTLSIDANATAGIEPISNAAEAHDPSGTPMNATGDPGEVRVSTCTCDCDGNGDVTVGEVVRGIRHALGDPLCSSTGTGPGCPISDTNTDGQVTIGEVVQCVSQLIVGSCL